jgi:hypothetical protein
LKRRYELTRSPPKGSTHSKFLGGMGCFALSTVGVPVVRVRVRVRVRARVRVLGCKG